MNLEKFLYNLHYDTDQASPPNWQPDWEDAPLPYKLYRGLPAFPFTGDVPLSLQKNGERHIPDFQRLGQFLWYSYGLSEVSQVIYEGEDPGASEVHQSQRRYPPSGGGLYPNELYVYVRMAEVPEGIYHYDTAHHRLLLVREGNADEYLSSCLGHDVTSCFAVGFVSAVFWKNFFKYNEFSYRLQGLDAGVLIGQMEETADYFGFSASVHYQFLDKAVNHLLGLDPMEERVYAAVPLFLEAPQVMKADAGSEELCQEIPPVRPARYERSKRILPYPALLETSDLSEMDHSRFFTTLPMRKGEYPAGIPLPPAGRLRYDFAEACRNRYSPEMDFRLGKISLGTVGALLGEASAAFRHTNDLELSGRTSMYLCCYNVEGIRNGAYQYIMESHSLRLLSEGDFRFYLQEAMTLDNLNLYQVPLTFHIAGERSHMIDELGYRGYRIQQMEAGMMTQKLLLAASALGMGGHPLLGFDVNACDRLYDLQREGKTCLIQIPVGPYESRIWLKGSLRG
ncbi:SagB family peptide dehydrogenase [Metabacillus sp. GX 13764]|uniref:SagB family peptide dehydrogenase n=1 Tax=Metabacillus kandeliae TaxID=2900151 RepID=UPI001E420E9C|nr:SagB family peptide dehydrogenase [Metabacillus kandeliae]MCD7034204.1 SagB family peptide dehydrogenase [Metabacillus kandeliae]